MTDVAVEFPTNEEIEKMAKVQSMMMLMFQEEDFGISEVIKVCTASMTQVVSLISEHEDEYEKAITYYENAAATGIAFLRDGTMPTVDSLVGGGVANTLGDTEI